MIVAATGHRPDKLGGYFAPYTMRLHNLARGVLKHMQPEKAISGMALGWDTAWAEAALELGIPLIAAIPFKGQESRWPVESQHRYHRICGQARDVVVCSAGGYAPFKMQTRNEWMVLQCDHLIALWDGSPGGTANCIAYAKELGRDTRNLWHIWQGMQRDL